MFPFVTTDSDLDLQREPQLSLTAPGNCDRSLPHRTWCPAPPHKCRTLLVTFESHTLHSLRPAEDLDTIHKGPSPQGDPVFSWSLLLTPKLFPCQILNRAHAPSVMFINMDTSCSHLNSLQVLLKGFSTAVFCLDPGCQFSGNTTSPRDQTPQHNGRIVATSSSVATQHLLTLNISGRTPPQNQCVSLQPAIRVNAHVRQHIISKSSQQFFQGLPPSLGTLMALDGAMRHNHICLKRLGTNRHHEHRGRAVDNGEVLAPHPSGAQPESTAVTPILSF